MVTYIAEHSTLKGYQMRSLGSNWSHCGAILISALRARELEPQMSPPTHDLQFERLQYSVTKIFILCTSSSLVVPRSLRSPEN